MIKKNPEDIRILETMIREQNEKGARLPTDLDNRRYSWDKDGTSDKESPRSGSRLTARLTGLDLGDCSIDGELDVSGFSGLKELHCFDNRITKLDVSGCARLETLLCDINPLETLDLSGCPTLKFLNAGGCLLTELDVTKNPLLEILYCDYNQLSVLDVTKNLALEELSCGSNYLRGLDVSRCLALESLDISKNMILKIDLTGNHELKYLNCDGITINMDLHRGVYRESQDTDEGRE